MLDNGLMNMMRVNAADRRTLLVAMMMAEGVESRVVDLVRTGREKLILVAGPATPRTPGHVAR